MCICDQYILGKIKVFCLLLANVLIVVVWVLVLILSIFKFF